MQKIFKELFKQFVAKNGVEPQGIELIQMKFKANELKRQADKVKVVDFKKTPTEVRPGQEATVNTLRPKSNDVAPGTLQADVENLKVDAEDLRNELIQNKNKLLDDLDTILETGGQPFKKKDNSFLGGSMHEESQIRTGIRQFLQDELKNGRLKLNADDTARVMEYFPTKEDDPILVFKRIYGDDAYEAAGKFPGAFEKGEDFNHYREIFKENMDESYLKVKTEENLGDGTLMLTDEVRTPIKDEDVPFADGGPARPGYQDGLKVYPKITASESNIGLGNGKNVDLKDLTYGGTLMYDQGPFSAGIEYLKGKDKFDFKDIDDTLEKDTTDREIANLILMMKLKNGLIKFKGNKDNQMINFSKSFAGGGVVKKIIKSITMKNKDPMDSMKELNEVLKRRKEFDLTDSEVDEIMEAGNEWIFQRDPDNVFLPTKDKPKTLFDDEVEEASTQVFKDSEGGIKGITMGGDKKFKDAMSEAMEEGIRESENMKRLGLDPTKIDDALKYDEMKEVGQMEKNVTGLADMSESDALMQKYPGMNKELADQIANDPDPNRKANVIAMVEQTFKLSEQGKSGDEIIEIFKKTPRTEQAGGGPITSTGLNYLLGEDDNNRVPYAAGGRRGFLKLLAGLGAAGAAFKSGLLGLSKGGAKKAVTETVKEAAIGQPPAYFFNLVAKIKTLGDDVTPTYAYKDRQKVTKYKDYELTEDLTSGKQEITKYQVLDNADAADYYGQPLTEETYMSFKPGKGQIDETTKGKIPPDEYEEGRAILRSDRGNAGEVIEEIDGVADEVIEEGTPFEDNLSDFGKADGGRIDRAGGGIMKIINKLKNKLKIKQSGDSVKDFIEKRKFIQSMVGNTEKNKKARELRKIKEDVAKYMEQYRGFKYEFPSDEQIKIDLEKRIQPILNKGRKLNATGGIITKLIKKLNEIDPGSTKRGKLSKPMSKKAKDKKELREAIENFSKRNRAR